MNLQDEQTRLQCVASQTSYHTSSGQGRAQSARTGQWSADGTCIVHVNANNSIETMVLPEDLLDNETRHDLKPYSIYNSADPIYATALYSHFVLSDPRTTLVLCATRDTPIQLRNALDYNRGVYATYSWCDPNTEAVITPRSLVFTADATHFVAGGQAQFAVYDVNFPSSKAISVRKTSRSRYATKAFGDPRLNATAPSSHIAAVDISSEDILALGTNTRHVALYANHGLGDLITSFRLPSPRLGTACGGKGITQIRWSADGTYLFIAERQSDTIELFDVRQSGKQLSWLSGRRADVNFQLSFDVVPTLHGLEIWGGGVDGRLRMWSNPEQQEGNVKFTQEWHVHDDPVCSTLVHASGTVVATLATKDRYGTRSHTASILSDESNDNSMNEEESSSDAQSEKGNDSDEIEAKERVSERPESRMSTDQSDPMLKFKCN
ncbi:uncharacterized protein PV09_02582 [Verruconis gallopava]|uniref:Anaphase-promoting complex subunit 4 WD40 domain-containing protein n=1 Tax=Verruconis gallopava TaxID=253628 RepID=A0A0D2AJ29_9PEZI|nr:uncharacterized protein PV09_02582 [Verruconis gallopava]KIW06913.1 hypothetical protein PV09_02582 [Verruconis gallopava]